MTNTASMKKSKMQVDTQSLKIPFRQTFAHASAQRSETASILTIATLCDGTIGYGESCPRPYVTGENLDSALAFHNTHKKSITQVDCLDALKNWMTVHSQDINANPAAFCALELALLDAFARRNDQTVEQYLGIPNISGSFHYTGVIGLGTQASLEHQLAQYYQAGLTEFKLKISGTISEDLAKINLFPDGYRIRLDANNRWRDAASVINYVQALPNSIAAIEEPLQAKNFEQLALLGESTYLPIILDESFTHLEDFDALPTKGHWIINCRLSKMGGLLRSLAIAKEAQCRSIPIIVGAQVGETSLLSRAALTLVQAFRESVIAQEGAFSTYLLQTDPFIPLIQFSQGGVFLFEAERFAKGFGVSKVVN